MTTPSRDDDLTCVRKLRIYLCILCPSSAQYCTVGSSCIAESSFLLPGRVQGRPDPPAWRHVCRTRRQGFVKRINSLSLKQPEKNNHGRAQLRRLGSICSSYAYPLVIGTSLIILYQTATFYSHLSHPLACCRRCQSIFMYETTRSIKLLGSLTVLIVDRAFL